ncbi:MAG TPA: PIN domain-containing protein [Longimicrobium sp.]|nr:PIN domain-containing protein [Longimicrobium sp.]
MLTDTGPILAMLDRGDERHDPVVALAKTFSRGPFVTTWPCFTEMMHLLGRRVGSRGQQALWTLRRGGRLALLEMTPDETDRCEALMHRYSDRPMDLGDASLVAVAESRAIKQIFTLDSDFWSYRLADGSVLETIPGPRH